MTTAINTLHERIKLSIKDKAAELNPSNLEVSEKSHDGAGTVKITTASDALSIAPQELNTPWLVNQQCADGAIITLTPELSLHIFELKSKLTSKKWASAVSQCNGMLSRARAMCGAVGHSDFEKITFYIAYSEDDISLFLEANPVLKKSLVGGGNSDQYTSAWITKTVTSHCGHKIPVVKIQRDASGNAAIAL